MADKKGRINEIIQRNLSEIILYELKDPITKFASVNEVKVTDDYSYCKVYVSHVKIEKCDELVAYLNHNSKKIRAFLAKKLDIYKTPELSFIRDVSYEKGKEMEDLIYNAIHKKPVTLKDIQAKEEKEALKAKKKEEAAKKKAASKKTATKKTATKKTTTKKTAKTTSDKE